MFSTLFTPCKDWVIEKFSDQHEYMGGVEVAWSKRMLYDGVCIVNHQDGKYIMIQLDPKEAIRLRNLLSQYVEDMKCGRIASDV